MEGIFPAPKAEAWPGSRTRHTANSSSQEPRGKENDGMTQPYSTDGGR